MDDRRKWISNRVMKRMMIMKINGVQRGIAVIAAWLERTIGLLDCILYVTLPLSRPVKLVSSTGSTSFKTIAVDWQRRVHVMFARGLRTFTTSLAQDNIISFSCKVCVICTD